LNLLTFGITRVRTRRAADCPGHSRGRPAAADPDSARTGIGEIELTFDSLEQALADGFQVIDIREADELARLATPCAGALHLPMAQLLYGRLDLQAGGRYLLVCASGRRSLAAAQELRSRGRTQIFSLRGGIAAIVGRGVGRGAASTV
jgi:rhodanese-related sulfurtransferase